MNYDELTNGQINIMVAEHVYGRAEPDFWIQHEDENPLRAAMIVYLKLREAVK